MPLRRSEQWFQNQDNELQAAQERAEEIHNRYDRLVLDYAKKDAELQAARGYMTRLFKVLAPQCEPFDNIMGVCTQIDNWSAGIKEKVIQLEQQLQDARDENLKLSALRTRLEALERCHDEHIQLISKRNSQLSTAQAEIERWSERANRESTAATKLQAEIERLKRDHINQMTELRFFERRLKEIL